MGVPTAPNPNALKLGFRPENGREEPLPMQGAFPTTTWCGDRVVLRVSFPGLTAYAVRFADVRIVRHGDA